MFGNSKKESPSRAGNTNGAAASNALNSLVAGTSVTGEVTSKNDIRIDGTISGSLDCEAKVIIGPSGKIDGTITCRNAVIEGKFTGNLYVQELLNIRENAHVEGEIRYSKLIVQPGAVLVGDVRLYSDSGSFKSKNKSQKVVEAKPNGKTTASERR